MGFSRSSKNIELKSGHILAAECRDREGNWHYSRLDLDQYIGNDDGHFVWYDKDFSLTAINSSVNANILSADLKKNDTSYRDNQRLDLDDHIVNEDGRLTFE
uniref:Cyanovirin-N domain-containing protein n=1 Tax=Photinus pyralis TaxID=7054 RepID=A0A1Y1KRI8_PHOPY